MDFAILLDALKQRMRQEVGRLPKCQVEGCDGIAWRNGYCADCVTHATLQRMLMAQRETNSLLRELLENGVAIGQARPRGSVPREREQEEDQPPERQQRPDPAFIPTIRVPEGAIGGRGGKRSIVIEDATKLDEANKIR